MTAEYYGAHAASGEYMSQYLLREDGTPTSVLRLIGPSQLDSLGEEGSSTALLSNWVTHTQDTFTPKAHAVGSVTERP